MTKNFYHIETKSPISVDDNAELSEFPNYTDVEPDNSKSTDDLKADFRHLRNSLLLYSDNDNAMAVDHPDHASLLAFRQKLRDVPQTISSFEVSSGDHFTDWETAKFQEIFKLHESVISTGFT
jgi:hypothetical protein